MQWREHSGHYLQALLAQSQERRNAENLAAVSARALQRFLTEARWDDQAVTGRLQEYLSPRLTHPLAVWVFDGSDFPKQVRRGNPAILWDPGEGGQLPGRDIPGPCGAPRTGAGG